MTVEPAATGEIMPEATLVDCEQALAAVERVASIQKGVIYRHIRDNRLYRERDYATFEGYCQSEYGLSARHVNRLIEAADVVEELGPIGPIQNESQARAIAPVLRDHGPGVAAEVLREAASDGKVTARSISEVAERVYRPTQPAKPETVVPTVVEDEPVEVLTSEEWHDANGFVHRYPPGVIAMGTHCWCGTCYLAAHILSSEVDGTVHARGWCDRLRPVPPIPPAAEAGGAVTAPLSP